MHQPQAFAQNFAIHLNFYSDRLEETGNKQDAAKAADEAVRVLEPVFMAYPQVVVDQMRYMLNDYINRSQAVGLKVDTELVERIQAKLGAQ